MVSAPNSCPHCLAKPIPRQEVSILSKPGIQCCHFNCHGGLSRFSPRSLSLSLRVEFEAVFPWSWVFTAVVIEAGLLFSWKPIFHKQRTKQKPPLLFPFFLPLFPSPLSPPSLPFFLLAYFSKGRPEEGAHDKYSMSSGPSQEPPPCEWSLGFSAGHSHCWFFFFKILFIHERQRETGRDMGRRRSRLPAGSLMRDLILGPGDHNLSWRQMLNHWTTQGPWAFPLWSQPQVWWGQWHLRPDSVEQEARLHCPLCWFWHERNHWRVKTLHSWALVLEMNTKSQRGFGSVCRCQEKRVMGYRKGTGYLCNGIFQTLGNLLWIMEERGHLHFEFSALWGTPKKGLENPWEETQEIEV